MKQIFNLPVGLGLSLFLLRRAGFLFNVTYLSFSMEAVLGNAKSFELGTTVLPNYPSPVLENFVHSTPSIPR